MIFFSLNAYLGAGSDHMSFFQFIGVPCIDQTHLRNKVLYKYINNFFMCSQVKRNYFYQDNPLFKRMSLDDWPTYHSSYETFNLVNNFVDSSFHV